MRRCGRIGCCIGLAVAGTGAAGALAAGTGGAAGLAVGGAGGVTITAGGTAGFSGAGPSGTVETAGFVAGVTAAAVFSGAVGLGTTTAGFSATAGGATGGFTTGVTAGCAGAAAGFATTGGRCCCSWRSFSSLKTSPGLEILERSILGLISDAGALSFEAGAALAEKCLRIFSASSSSMELEWVFFSVIPRSSNTSRMALLFTSSSLARSLIRIFIPSVFPPNTRYAFILTSRL